MEETLINTLVERIGDALSILRAKLDEDENEFGLDTSVEQETLTEAEMALDHLHRLAEGEK